MISSADPVIKTVMTPLSLVMEGAELSSPSSTSASDDSSPRNNEEKAGYRKSNKPMMEKKRRARINICLSQLKSLVLQAMRKDNSQYSKLEKADILELTVRHLKTVQRQQNLTVTQFPDAVSKYQAGYNECANEVIKYLAESKGVNDDARTRILSHLASILNPINTLPLQQTHTSILPTAAEHIQQQQQQQQLNLQQLHFQQQQNQKIFLTPSSQPVFLDTNNNKQIIPHPAFLTAAAGKTIDINQVISGPAAATTFHCPIATGAPSAGLQLPYLSTTNTGTLTQLQLVPSMLPSGQMALVLTPQPLPATKVYAAHEGSRQVFDPKLHNIPGFKHSKLQPPLRSEPTTVVTKPSGIQNHDSGLYHKSSTPSQTSISVSRQSNTAFSTPMISSQPSGLTLKQSELILTQTLPQMTAMARSVTDVPLSSAGGPNANIIRTVSTWRPW